ncbi:HNH endonuclease [Pantoea vagans]|uniref:HNH endonuclease n=1 Tax=Pantoea vagans TaxID=470934 RepID=A0ABY3LK80_9GAMM|nr:HNH endonuclease [Pantoea vagans]
MTVFSFDNNEKGLIEDAIKQGHKFWSDDSLEDIKRRIKDHLRAKQNECCCYCSRNTDDEFNMVLDIEHIIPKSKLVSEMFEMMNLAVSCKRCNMRIKREDVSFIDGFENFKNKGVYYASESYKFIHPNLDEWDDKLMYVVAQINRKKIVYYEVVNKNKKGTFAKKYFQLDKIEVNTFDEAQNAGIRKEPSDPNIARKYLKLVTNLLGLK